MRHPDLLLFLRAFPRIYSACHARHPRRRTTSAGLTAHDAAVLGHFDRDRTTSPGALAGHLGLAPSSVSAVLKRMVERGFLTRGQRAGNRRVADLRLTDLGERAMCEASILDPVRVDAVLSEMRPSDRKRALEGLGLWAEAARRAEATWRASQEKETR